MILCGDIGGTKTLLALAADAADAPQVVFERRYASNDYADLDGMIDVFLAEARSAGQPVKALAAACFGVAGPVDDGRAKVTYLPWVLDAGALAGRHDLPSVLLLNDFAAAAAGIATLGPGDLVTLQAGEPLAHAPRAVLGAGTGLGVAFLLPEGGGWRTLAGEGGHVGFAPADEEQIALWQFLHRRHERVTAERVLSGSGLVDVYRFVSSERMPPESPDPLAAEVPAAAIAAAARAHPSGAAAHSLGLFAAVYGAFAGDLALTVMARGGVFLAGGIAPKILPWLRQAGFAAAFNAKEAHSALAASMPVHVVVNERLGLQGAAWLALAAERRAAARRPE
jgi:glucokinase